MTGGRPSMIDIHNAALESSVTKYHEFILRYSKHKRVVYGFVEGKDDPSFYRGFIDSILPDGWEVELWPAGNKDKVFEIYRQINWRKFRKNRICFFVDRDISELVSESIPKDRNIYVTPNYSIENDVAKADVCKKLLTEICGFAYVDHAEIDSVGQMYSSEFDKFCKLLAPIMAWIILWKREGKKPCLNDIYMKDMFHVVPISGKPCVAQKTDVNIVTYIHEQCNITRDAQWDTGTIEAFLRSASNYRKYARGKYVFWFLIEFCLSVHANSTTVFSGVQKPPKIRTTISHTNAMAIVGNRARIPHTLRELLKATYLAYIETQSA